MRRFMAFVGFRSCAPIALLAFVFLFTRTGTQAQTPTELDRAAVASSQISWHTDLRSGWAEAHRRNAPMVIFVTSDHCHYCDAMKNDTWASGSVASRLSEGFVAIELKPDRNPQALAQIEVPAYPTTLVADPDGRIVAHRIGYQGVNEMMGLLAEADSDRSR